MKKELYIILHNIRSAYNVGSMFRTADGMGVKKIYLTGYTASPYCEKDLHMTKPQKMISKTALGADEFVSWEKASQIGKLISRLKSEKIEIVALEQDKKSVNYKKFKPKFPLALIVGNEPKGIDKKILKKCDQIIEIPMKGEKKSLNVAVSIGIAGYEISSKIK